MARTNLTARREFLKFLAASRTVWRGLSGPRAEQERQRLAQSRAPVRLLVTRAAFLDIREGIADAQPPFGGAPAEGSRRGHGSLPPAGPEAPNSATPRPS